MYSFSHIDFEDQEQQNSGQEGYFHMQGHQFGFPISENQHSNNAEAQMMENVGNQQNLRVYTEPNIMNLKKAQDTAVQIEKSNKSEYTETLAVFQRIYSKIVSSYLGQISSNERKPSKKLVYFDKCGLYSDLQVEGSFITLKQVINRVQLQFSQKCSMFEFLDSHNQLRIFLTTNLLNCYEEINNDFVYFVYDLIQELKPLVFPSEKTAANTEEQTDLQPAEKKNEGLENEKLMKKHLQEIAFFQRIYYEKTIRYLNCQEISTPVSDEKVKQFFIRFARLYSHLLIKLIIMDMPQPESKKNKIPVKRMNSCEQRLMEIKKQNGDEKDKYPNEIIGNWFATCSVAKSFNSINSLGSINMNNLNDIKIYNSKPDLWSDNEEEDDYGFSEEEQEIMNRRKK